MVLFGFYEKVTAVRLKQIYRSSISNEMDLFVVGDVHACYKYKIGFQCRRTGFALAVLCRVMIVC